MLSIKKDQQIREVVTVGRVGLLFGEHWMGGRFVDNKTKDSNADWISLPIPGNSSIIANANNAWGYVIKKEAKNPEAIVKMMNLSRLTMSSYTDIVEKYFDSKEISGIWQLSPVGINYYAAPGNCSIYCMGNCRMCFMGKNRSGPIVSTTLRLTFFDEYYFFQMKNQTWNLKGKKE